MNNELRNEIDMLNGNINRMCVTDDGNELLEMYDWANRRISNIYLMNSKRLKDKENEH